LACMCSFFGVLFISVPLGLSIAVSWEFIYLTKLKYTSLQTMMHRQCKTFYRVVQSGFSIALRWNLIEWLYKKNLTLSVYSPRT
jgi:hypothetical protein